MPPRRSIFLKSLKAYVKMDEIRVKRHMTPVWVADPSTPGDATLDSLDDPRLVPCAIFRARKLRHGWKDFHIVHTPQGLSKFRPMPDRLLANKATLHPDCRLVFGERDLNVRTDQLIRAGTKWPRTDGRAILIVVQDGVRSSPVEIVPPMKYWYARP